MGVKVTGAFRIAACVAAALEVMLCSCGSGTPAPEPTHADAATATARDAQCNDNQKIRLYPDLDGDGFGDASSPGLLFCGATEHYVVDHSDCADGDPNAHPGQQMYFAVPIHGTVSTGLPFDYDCDGNQSLEWTALESPNCSQLPADQCDQIFPNGGAWADGAVPGCGAPQAVWADGCQHHGTGPSAYCASRDPIEKTQACR